MRGRRPVIVGRIFQHTEPPLPWDRTPIRAELFGADRLEQLAKSIAAAQPVTRGQWRDGRLAARLADNAAFLLQANRTLAQSAENGHHATPAAEWLADNYHLVDMQIREIGIDLPPGFYAQLPKLAVDPFAGLPRVFGAAWSFVAQRPFRNACGTADIWGWMVEADVIPNRCSKPCRRHHVDPDHPCAA